MDGTNLSDVESATRVNPSPKSPEPQRPEDLFFPNKKKQKDISGSRALYGALKDNDSARKWAVRTAIAAAVAVVGGLITSDWRIGATLGLGTLVGITVHRSRRESEIPRWRKPSAAQRKTEVQLKVMKQLGYKILHARSVPGGNGQIDHFIVGRRGAFAIDSESWDKRLPLRNKLEQLYHGRFNKNDRIDEALEEAKRAEELISKELGREIKVRASLAIYGPGMPWDSHRLRGVDIISGTKVRKWLRTGRDRLTEEEIDDIFRAAERVLPPRP
ncbi:nuclease-related domain-containing protein [Nocardiopsis sp. DSM 44743]|uniref:Nuclease-related domain-containing protein n=1 Tax=Nocardiopsis lambiniae TaxID=3075539 RepID=A0ABU2MI90_9ACTN|nr:nuclease-related domain-containing protein [Nocardiopsis sp. DSM 44743]MDT0331805.1 nuclease-related domain-containing protein [Nocardiopsis sp. DSM 44743]